MKKVNLNFQIKDISGAEIPGDDNNAGKLLGSIMYNFSSGKSIKMTDLAIRFYRGESVEIDETDAEALVLFIETYGVNPKPTDMILSIFTDGVKSQIIKAIKN